MVDCALRRNRGKRACRIMLRRVERELGRRSRQHTQNYLSIIFKKIGCGGIAREIRRGNRVTDNARMGIVLCVHDKVGPTVNPETLKFYPQTDRQRRLEHKFIDTTNKMLKTGGFREIRSLKRALRRKDLNFERRIKRLRTRRR